MNNTTLELTAVTGNFPLARETSRPLEAGASPETKCTMAATGRKSLLAKWLLLPLTICASVLLVKVMLVAGDLLKILNDLYAGGHFS